MQNIIPGRKPGCDHIPAGPVHRPPAGFIPTPGQRELLGRVFGAIQLGVYDRRILDWLAGWDTPTVLTVCSLVSRTREAGAAGIPAWGLSEVGEVQDAVVALLAAQRAGDTAEMERIKAGLTLSQLEGVLGAITSELNDRLMGEIRAAQFGDAEAGDDQ